jgi:hypothetical protein
MKIWGSRFYSSKLVMLHDDLIVFSPKKYYFVYIEMAILGGDPLFLDRDKARPAWSARNWGKRSPGWSR